MADNVETLLNGINPSATGVDYSSPIASNSRRNFYVFLSMPSTTGSAVNDLMDFWIEQSTEQGFTTEARKFILPLTNPTTGSISKFFTRVTGNLTLPSATVDTSGAATTENTTLLRQYYQLDVNPNNWIRCGYRVQGTPGSFTNIYLYLFSDSVP